MIDNPNGVTTTSTGEFSPSALRIIDGTFLAPSGLLSVGHSVKTEYWSDSSTQQGAFYLGASGLFSHNNGSVSFKYYTQYNDTRIGAEIESEGGVIAFNNLEVDLRGDFNVVASAPDPYALRIADPIQVDGNLVVTDGRVVSNTNSFTQVDIKGNLTLSCTDPTNTICGRFGNWLEVILSGTAGSLVTIDPNSNGMSLSKLTIDPGVGNTVTFANSLNMNVADNTNEILNVNSGTLHLNDNVEIRSEDLVINGAITCGTAAQVRWGTSPTGTPAAGNATNCYSSQ